MSAANPARPNLGVRSRSRRVPKPATAPRLPWGWLEWFLIAQTFIPALLFIPGASPIRTPIRVASFAIGLVAWGFVLKSGRSRPGASSFPANLWLGITAVWLLLLIVHPDTNSLTAGLAHAMLYISILCPAFWAPSALIASRQIGRLMWILFLCNALSAAVGLGQVFRPEIFNPPVIPAMVDQSLGSVALTYTDAFGNKIIRPCGLTDQVGAAAGAGATAALIGICLALRPLGFPKRAVCLGLAFVGVAVIYYSQVRMSLLMLVCCIATLIGLFVLQRNLKNAAMLGGFGFALIAGALTWVAATSGDVVVGRFLELLQKNPSEYYYYSRGMYVQNAVEDLVWRFPFGAGLGWWGQIYQFFGDKTIPTDVWVEVMIPAWIVDGGIPLLGLYLAAIVGAMYDSTRIALTSRNRDLAFWASVVVASNLSLLATCFSYVTFVSGTGMQFWILSAALHAADLRDRSKPIRQPFQGSA